jgi:hypothetical protein
MESFTSYMKNQLSFNKMIESQLAQLATSLPSYESGGIPRQPKPTREHVYAISTGLDKPSKRTCAPNHVGKPIHQIQDPRDESAVLHKKDSGYLGITCTIYYQEIKNALCDLGASVYLIPKSMFEVLGYSAISPTRMTIQLADSIDQISRRHSRKSLGECKRLVCICGFRGPRHTRRNSAHSRATIPKRCQ